jgi:hypothetical protein
MLCEPVHTGYICLLPSFQQDLSTAGAMRYGQVKREETMKRIILALLITTFAAGTAMAQSCESRAMSKDGKPLHGAAKTSFVKKCQKDACEGKAVSKEGKPLYGAAKNSFLKKCRKAA